MLMRVTGVNFLLRTEWYHQLSSVLPGKEVMINCKRVILMILSNYYSQQELLDNDLEN